MACSGSLAGAEAILGSDLLKHFAVEVDLGGLSLWLESLQP